MQTRLSKGHSLYVAFDVAATVTEIAEDGAVKTIPDSTFNGVRSSVRRLLRILDDSLYRGAPW